MMYVYIPPMLADSKQNRHFPSSLVLRFPPLKIGIVHGHQVIPAGDPLALSLTALSMDVDILLTGGTSKFEAYKLDDRFFLNPGSATGAWTVDMPIISARSNCEKNHHTADVNNSFASDGAKTGSRPMKSDLTNGIPAETLPSFACTSLFALT